MKMEGLTTFMKDRPETKKVFLLNQNYSHGHQVAKFFKEGISRKRPDIQIVGEDLHPLGQVRDFAPYIAKIKASGADSIVTGNWGSDLQLFVKAANEGGFTGNFYTYYTSVTGTPTALGKTGEGRVFQIGNGHARMGGEMDKWQDEYKAKLNDDFYTGQIINIYTTLSEAMAKSKSTDPVKVAAALSGMKTKSVFNGEIEVRKTDHQLQQALFITVWGKVDKKYSYSMENTGMTMIPVKQYPNYVSSTPTSCQMKRPA
jgi:branched-chain amino acid transport system substrate-binding protein